MKPVSLIVRLPQVKVSFCTVRAVELSRTSVVFLAVGCHRILGARRLSLASSGSLRCSLFVR
jgi:hypothetical protein